MLHFVFLSTTKYVEHGINHLKRAWLFASKSLCKAWINAETGTKELI